MRLKFFFSALLLGLPLVWGFNVSMAELGDLLFLRELAKNPQILTSSIAQSFNLAEKQPVEDLKIEARAAEILWLSKDGAQRIIYEKNSEEKFPIASLAKLMAADIILENFNLSDAIEISQRAVSQGEDFGQFKTGETFKAQDLLYSALMESSNDAVYALSEIVGPRAFVNLMNLEAKYLGLENTNFINPTGLDSKDPQTLSNLSTAKDLAALADHLFSKPLFREIISLSEYNLFTSEGVFHHKTITTNEFLKTDSPFWNASVIGGKTGETPQSKGCLLVISKAPRNQGYLISVILGSDDRFGEMKKMLDWANVMYNF